MPGQNTTRTAVVNKNGVLTHVHKNADGGKSATNNRVRSVGAPKRANAAKPVMHESLSDQQKKVLKSAYSLKPVTMSDGSVHDPGHLVSGHEYRSAIALENKGLASVRYQGKSLGWIKLTAKGSAAANFERITDEANITDPADPKYNTDMDSIVAGTTKTYRDMILSGLDPNYEVNFEVFRDIHMER